MWAHSNSLTQSYCTALNVLCAPPLYPFFPPPLGTTDFTTACFSLFLNCCEKPWPKPTWERKGLFSFEVTAHCLGIPSQELKAKTHHGTWLSLAPCPACLLLARSTCLGMTPPTGGWAHLQQTGGEYRGERSRCGEKLGSVDEGEREIRK